MGGRLAGKTAVVTAAGAGIGRATAVAFATEGATVWATDIDKAAVDSLAAAHPGMVARRLDVTDAAAVGDLAREVGAAGVLFNCAGFVHGGTILNCTEDEWHQALDLNVRSMVLTIRAFLPAMLDAGGASIINMSSVAGAVTGVPNRFIYSTTKAAVVGLTKSVAADFVARGIRCNAVCAGTVDTPSLAGRMAAAPDPEMARRDFIARQPLGRLGRPEEVAALCVHLASDESAYTTGAIHVIDGGWTT